MIDSRDVSVVIQGAIDKLNTMKACASVRKFLPNSRLILSTWIGSDVTGLEFDEIIFNQDPGGFPYYAWRKKSPINNTNRQLVSTINGLKRVNTKYALKMRTDFALTGDNFLKIFEGTKSMKRIFPIATKERVLVYSAVDLDNGREIKPYHLSDFYYFGLTEDLLDLFDIPLVDDSEKVYNKMSSSISNRYAPEQHIFVNMLRKHFDVEFDSMFDFSAKIKRASEMAIVNNCYVVPCREFNIVPLKVSLLPNTNLISRDFMKTYSQYRYFKLYNKYIDKKFEIPFRCFKIEIFCRIALFFLFPLFGILILNKTKRKIIRTGFIKKLEDIFIWNK